MIFLYWEKASEPICASMHINQGLLLLGPFHAGVVGAEGGALFFVLVIFFNLNYALSLDYLGRVTVCFSMHDKAAMHFMPK